MKLSKEQLEAIEKFSRDECSKNDMSHREEHILDTVRLSRVLVKREGGDENKSIVIAYLHDISKYEQYKGGDHGSLGAIKARKFLEGIGIDNVDIDDVCYAIHEHNKGEKKKTVEANIIYDADKLQTLGGFGLLRCYTFNIVQRKIESQEGALQKTIEDMNFFKAQLKTDTAKKMVASSEKFMKDFLKSYNEIKEAKI